jgi:dual specificity phosphatase 12
MSQILPNLILGSFEESFNSPLLVDVTHVLNVASECYVSERVGKIYKKVAVPDDCPSADITTIFPLCIDFIVTAHETNGCVFVHCLEGVSRSVCVVLCYLVQHQGWTTAHALEHLSLCRPHIDPFPIYLTQTTNHLSKYNGSGKIHPEKDTHDRFGDDI